MDIHVRRMANHSDMNVQATGIVTAHFALNFSTAVLSAFRFPLSAFSLRLSAFGASDRYVFID